LFVEISEKLYGNAASIEERHRHRYEVNPVYVEQLESKGMKFVGHDSEKVRMEIMELEGHPYYVAVQFHPEYLSRPLKPSPPFLGLVLASVGKLKSYLDHGCRFSPRQTSDESSGKLWL
jgi:CTP synthase